MPALRQFNDKNLSEGLSGDMALAPDVCVQTGSSGLDPSGGFRLPDVDALDAAAHGLQRHAQEFLAGISASAVQWQGLGSSFSTDDAPTVLAAFGKVTPAAERVQRGGASTASALTAFSSTCRELKQRLEAYGRRVHSLDADIDSFPTSVEKTTMVKGEQVTTNVTQHWTGDADLTARHNALAADREAIFADYCAAQNTCAAALAAVSGGDVHTVAQAPVTDLRSGNWVDDWLWDAGTFLGIDHHAEGQPWGKQTVPYRPNGTLGFLQGVGAGAVELIDGVWSLTGTGNQAKRDQAWGGINTLITNPGSVDWGSVLSSFAHLDEAGTNQNWAVGAAVFNTASLFVGGGAGAAVKSGTVAAKAGLAAEKLSIATMDSARLGTVSTLLGTAAQGLYSTGIVLSKPGSLALKVSDLVMPRTTANVLDALTKVKVSAWMAAEKAPAALWDHAVARPLEGASTLLRATDQAVPKVAVSPGGAASLGHGSMGRMADSLDTVAAHVRAAKVPETPIAQVVTPVEHFPKPETVTETVVLRHRDANFPVSMKDNFAARLGLKPNTEYVVEHRTKMNQVTGDEVNSIEKYYTDATGRVVRVDTYAGVRGAWSPELNKPVPNVTYNVVAKVDGGLENSFTIMTDGNAHIRRMSGHVASTFVGDMNRNGWQQLKAGRLGGPGYDGGHAAPSSLGFIGERAGLFPQHQWQNRGIGPKNDELSFSKIESEVIAEVKQRVNAGRSVDLSWEMEMLRSPNPRVPASVELRYSFGRGKEYEFEFNNLFVG